MIDTTVAPDRATRGRDGAPSPEWWKRRQLLATGSMVAHGAAAEDFGGAGAHSPLLPNSELTRS